MTPHFLPQFRESRDSGATAVKSMTFVTLESSCLVITYTRFGSLCRTRFADDWHPRTPPPLRSRLGARLRRNQPCATLFCATLMPRTGVFGYMARTKRCYLFDRAWILVRQLRTSWPQFVENALAGGARLGRSEAMQENTGAAWEAWENYLV